MAKTNDSFSLNSKIELEENRNAFLLTEQGLLHRGFSVVNFSFSWHWCLLKGSFVCSGILYLPRRT